jgi:hypothetical protein
VSAPEVIDRQELFNRVSRIRSEIVEEIGVAALIAVPTKQCDRLVAGLLDALNGLEALLRVSP